jgi:uncharacterized protein YeaC (DUF1315 family)
MRLRAVCIYKAYRDLSEQERSVLTNTQVIYNRTQHSGQVFYFFYKIQMGSYKACGTANQIARNMSVIL